jgi:hypothetical protein
LGTTEAEQSGGQLAAAEATGGMQEQGVSDHPGLVVAGLVAGSLLDGCHGGELVGPEGPVPEDRVDPSGIGLLGEGVVRHHPRQLCVGEDHDLGPHAQVFAAAIIAVSASSLVKTTLPLWM